MFFQGSFWVALAQIIGVNIVLSGDNAVVIAMACRSLAPSQQKKGIAFGSAGGDTLLMVLGLLISIPLIVLGSAFMMRLMDRLPIIITGGAALLGYIAGEMAITDIAIKEWVDQNMHGAHLALPILFAVLVVLAGTWLNRRARMRSSKGALDDLVEPRPLSGSEPAD
jgi:predicted tellurium resistance membrane protein TerC